MEAAENFTVTLTGASGGGGSHSNNISGTEDLATGTIAADSVPISIAAPGAATAEGAEALFVVSVTQAPSEALAVSYQVAATTATGDMDAAGADFSGGSFPTGMVTIAASATMATITVGIADDSAQEPVESYQVTISNPQKGSSDAATYTLGTATAVSSITASDRSFSVAAPSPNIAAEGSSLTYAVSLAGAALTAAATVTYDLSGDVAAGDFATTAGGSIAIASLASRTVEMTAGERSATIIFHLLDDSMTEAAENFTVTLTGASGGGSETNNVSATAADGTINASDDPILTVRRMADINGDTTLDGDDALIMYQVYVLGGAGVNQAQRDAANSWKSVGRSAGGDLNSDGEIDGDDVLILYYAATFRELLQAHARLRAILLGELVNDGIANPGDADYREMLRQANQLLDAVNNP